MNDMENPEKFSIVIVDDIPENLRLLAGILKENGLRVRPSTNGPLALAAIKKEPPELILLDIMMPEMDGYEVCRQLKSDDGLKDIPVIFLSALNEIFDKVKAFQLGAVDYISKPFKAEEVLARVNTHLKISAQQKKLFAQNQELIKKNAIISEQAEKLKLMAATDFLTRLSNRRAFLERAQVEEARFRRSQRPFAIILLDIDHFKDVNDRYGHECGDKVLVNVAGALKRSLRTQDIVARWGGEEFICLLPETEHEGAMHVAEKIRTEIQGLDHMCSDSHPQITATLGVSVYNRDHSIDECIRKADDALYKGKNQGRNQVVDS